MSRVPLGKVLLRNVIRHTDAHNKIQEESEMWKIREMEKQSQEIHWGTHQRTLLNSSSSRMRSDGFDEDSQQATCRTRNMPVMAVTIEDDLRHARYWNKKLYECEANMPDRWGHSGYKELYPEEFDTESDREPDEQNSVNGKRKSQSDKPSSVKLHKRKKAKKSHKKKQKKKSHKKKKKKKRETGAASSQESECSEGEPPKRKKKRHAKSKKASEGPPASSLDPGSGSSKASSCLSSHSGESDSEEPARKRRKRQASLSERAGDRAPEKRSKRKNWKVAADENSEDSSEED